MLRRKEDMKEWQKSAEVSAEEVNEIHVVEKVNEEHVEEKPKKAPAKRKAKKPVDEK